MPDEVSDTEFWRNYFYHIELYCKEQGFESRLGELKDEQARQAAVDDELRRANEEINRLKEESEAAGTPVRVSDDTQADLVNSQDETNEIEL